MREEAFSKVSSENDVLKKSGHHITESQRIVSMKR